MLALGMVLMAGVAHYQWGRTYRTVIENAARMERVADMLQYGAWKMGPDNVIRFVPGSERAAHEKE